MPSVFSPSVTRLGESRCFHMKTRNKKSAAFRNNGTSDRSREASLQQGAAEQGNKSQLLKARCCFPNIGICFHLLEDGRRGESTALTMTVSPSDPLRGLATRCLSDTAKKMFDAQANAAVALTGDVSVSSCMGNVFFAAWFTSVIFLHRQGAPFLSAGGRGGQRRAERLLPVHRHGQSFRDGALPAGGENAPSFQPSLPKGEGGVWRRPRNAVVMERGRVRSL